MAFESKRERQTRRPETPSDLVASLKAEEKLSGTERGDRLLRLVAAQPEAFSRSFVKVLALLSTVFANRHSIEIHTIPKVEATQI